MRAATGHSEALIHRLEADGIQRRKRVWLLFADSHELEQEVSVVAKMKV